MFDNEQTVKNNIKFDSVSGTLVKSHMKSL